MCKVLSRHSQNSFKDLSAFFQSSLSSFKVLSVLSKFFQNFLNFLEKQKRGNIKSDEKIPKHPKIKAKNVTKKQKMKKKWENCENFLYKIAKYTNVPKIALRHSTYII